MIGSEKRNRTDCSKTKLWYMHITRTETTNRSIRAHNLRLRVMDSSWSRASEAEPTPGTTNHCSKSIKMVNFNRAKKKHGTSTFHQQVVGFSICYFFILFYFFKPKPDLKCSLRAQFESVRGERPYRQHWKIPIDYSSFL